MMEKYYLSHITTSDCISGIKKNGFKKSIHTEKTSQWLGDGVYFWDNNDKKSIFLGKKMVKNKKGNLLKKIVRISRLITIDEEKHLNLDNDIKAKQFEKFLLTSPISDEICGKELLDMLEHFRQKNNIAPIEKKKLGKLFGDCLNAYIKLIENSNECIDVTSYSFYGGVKKSILHSNEELNCKQFCIRNLNLINKDSIKDEELDII